MLISFDKNPVERLKGFSAIDDSSSSFTFSRVTIEEGAVLPRHSHSNLQISICEKGDFELFIEDVQWQLTAGSVCVIPSNAIHHGKAVTACVILEIFYPTRDDWK